MRSEFAGIFFRAEDSQAEIGVADAITYLIHINIH